MERSSEYWVTKLGLQPHPEGGFFRETYRAGESTGEGQLPARFGGPRAFSTAIYFLLPSGDRSHFHRIQSDELWHFHTGSALDIYLLEPTGVRVLKLGPDPSAGQSFQHVVPANTWFGSAVATDNSFALCSCTVAPGFDFSDFELAGREALLTEYPHARREIMMLTRP